MKTPIEPSQIRRNDLIRWEKGATSPSQAFEAAEFFATSDGEGRRNHDGQHFLLDRPTPPVELPSAPTAGWLSWRDTDPPAVCDTTEYGHWQVAPTGVHAISQSASVPLRMVTEFRPASVVPTEALDRLRADSDCSGPLSCLREHVDTFLSSIPKGGE